MLIDGTGLDSERNKIIADHARQGIEYFNRGMFFEAHEELEAAWKAEPGAVRNLYRGILQVAVAYHHLERDNFNGAIKVFTRSKRWLNQFSGVWMGIDMDRFKADAVQIETLAIQGSSRAHFRPPPQWPPRIVMAN